MDLTQIIDTAGAITARLIRLDFVGLRRLIKVNSLFNDDVVVTNFSNMDKLAHTITLPTASAIPSVLKSQVFNFKGDFDFGGQKFTLDAYKSARRVTGLLIIKGDTILHEDYLQGTTAADLRIGWSMSKSITAVLLGVLIDRGLIAKECLDYTISDYLPALRNTGYDGVTLGQVMMMTSGVRFNEDYHDYHSDINRMGRVLAVHGSMDDFVATLGRQYEAGRYFHYVSINTHVIGMMIRALCKQPIADLLLEYVLRPLHLESDCKILTDSSGEPFILGGLNMTLRDYARFGKLIMDGGQCMENQLVSSAWLDKITTPHNLAHHPDKVGLPFSKLGYGMHWWHPHNGQVGERFCAGIYGQYIYQHQASNMMIVQTAVDKDFDQGDYQMLLNTIDYMRQLAKAAS